MPRTTDARPIKPPTEGPHAVGLRAIAAYKAAKCISLLLVAVAAFRLVREQNFVHLVHWLESLSLTGSSELRWRLVNLLTAMGPRKFVAVGCVALAYAALFAVEGIGLWLRLRWAQWLTVIATGSLVPLEIYELVQRFSVPRLLVLLVNIAVVLYLLHTVRESRATEHGPG